LAAGGLHRLDRSTQVTVLAAPVPQAPASPTLEDEELREPYWDFGPAERRCITAALAVRRAAPDLVQLRLVAAGPPMIEDRLRAALAAGVDEVVRIDAPASPGDAVQLASALATAIQDRPQPHLIMMGQHDPATQRGVLPGLVAAILGRWVIGEAGEMRISQGTRPDVLVRTSLGVESPGSIQEAVVAFAAGPASVEFGALGFLSSVSVPIPVCSPAPIATDGRYALPTRASAADEIQVREATPAQIAALIRELLGLSSAPPGAYAGPLPLAAGLPSSSREQPAVVYLPPPGGEQWSRGAVEAARVASDVAACLSRPLRIAAFLPSAADEADLRQLAAPFADLGAAEVILIPCPELAGASAAGLRLALRTLLERQHPSTWLMTLGWARDPLAMAARDLRLERIATGVREIDVARETLVTLSHAYEGRLRLRQEFPVGDGSVLWLLEPGARFSDPDPVRPVPESPARFLVLPLTLDYDSARDPLARPARDGRERAWWNADCIIDLGYALRNRDNLERLVVPLEARLRAIGVRSVGVGGTRKVTEELKLIPPDRQIGQTGVAVSPAVLLAVGVSGAPQHLDYIGERTTIIAFNRDSEAPIMSLNRRKPLPRVYPVPGDLFKTLPALIEALEKS
jgi:electron transfer flavoprotein alpha subunit